MQQKKYSKRIRRISPLGMRVLVRIERESNQTETGLYLPEGAKQTLQESIIGEVIEVASATDHHLDVETNISGIPLGARILLSKNSGVKIPWDDELRLIETKEVLAIVDEVSII